MTLDRDSNSFTRHWLKLCKKRDEEAANKLRNAGCECEVPETIFNIEHGLKCKQCDVTIER